MPAQTDDERTLWESYEHHAPSDLGRDSIALLREKFQILALTVHRQVPPGADRGFAERQLRTAYLTSVAAIEAAAEAANG